MDTAVQTITVYILPVIFAITLHEAAHGYVARHFGDLTAYSQGRVSLNPLRHIDPIGTVLLPVLVVLASVAAHAPLLIFGWAKPVPVNFSNLRNPRKDMLWVALAGPAMNLVMALLWAGFLKGQIVGGLNEEFFASMARAGISINLSFMLLNLLPILPLDGGRVLYSLLPPRVAWQYGKSERYGIFIVLILLTLRVLQWVLTPLMILFLILISFGFQLPIQSLLSH